MSILKHLLSFFILFFFLLSSFTYSQSITGVAKKTGGIGLAIQGVKVGKEGLKQLTTYGQELATQQDNQTKQTSEQQDIQTNEISQQSIKQNIQTKQQTQQNSNNNILDNLASSMQDSTDKLKTGIDKSTKPLQNTISDIGNLFSKIKGSVSSDDNSKEQEQTETSVTSDNKNNKNDNKSDGDGGNEFAKIIEENDGNRFNHIFNNPEHNLDKLVNKFGSQKKAFDAVQKAANKALKEGKLPFDAQGKLAKVGEILNVEGIKVTLIGGRVINGRVVISSFSRRGL